MATPNIKNQNTLFRFVSHRNPELTKLKDKEKRFVFHPDNKTGFFFEAMLNGTANQTKWQVLQNACNGFDALLTESAVKEFAGQEICTFSDFIANNRSAENTDLLAKQTNGLNPLNEKQIFALWDNLFYQVVTQKAFYVKELIMQVLVANNLLLNLSIYRKSNIEIFTNDYFTFANARVVLPANLFEVDNTRIALPTGLKATKAGLHPSEQKLLTINDANSIIVVLEKAKTEIQKQAKQYQKEYYKNYQTVLANYEDQIAPVIEEYNKQLAAEKERICKEPKSENPNDFCNQPQTQFPQLPKFQLDFLPPIASLQKLISAESFKVLEKIDALKNADTYNEIIENVDEEIAAQYQIALNNTTFSEQILLAGGIAIPVVENKTSLHERDGMLDEAFVPEKFGVRQIGIADYKKVVAHICCYDAGEVSHIENIMAREMRSKSTTRERIEEITQTSETSQERESLTDTTTSERFEMQSEVSKILQEQKQFDAHANLKGTYGIVSFDTGANYATNTSKEESNRQAVTQAKDITQRASERIVTKMRNEVVRKTTERFKEENDHVFDNRLGDKHVAGVYRFINAIYKNQVHNYGKRMMYEFMIPQPSKLHRLGLLELKSNATNSTIIEKPIDPRSLGLNSADDINRFNYKTFASAYGASVTAFSDYEIYVGKTFDHYTKEGDVGETKTGSIPIPNGYVSQKAHIYYTGLAAGGGWLWPRGIFATIGNQAQVVLPQPMQDFGQYFFSIKQFSNDIPVAISITNMHLATVNFTVLCSLSTEKYETQQQDIYASIIKAYEDKLAVYNASLAQNDTSFGTNPGFYRQIEQLGMRKNCISYLMDEVKMGQGFYTGTTLGNYALQQTQAMDNYASHAKFMEQAFEWNLLSYNFYPFYWGKRTDWPSLYQFECNDPLFRSFMQAGMARVVVTVKPGFENAVMHYMATGQIWNGGQVPVLDNPLYLSIVDELKEQEYVVEETWETVVPTSLVALQSSGVAINAEGLPCGTDCIDHAAGSLINNGNTIMGK